MKKKLLVVFCTVALILSVSVFTACGSGYDDKAVLDSISAMQSEIDALKQENKDLRDQIFPTETSVIPVYRLGQIFTYVSAGIPLFTVTVEKSSINSGYNFTVKNLNIPSTPPGNYMQIRYEINENVYSHQMSTTVSLKTNSERTEYYSLYGNATELYIGFPINSTSYVVPYVIYSLA